MLPGLKVNIQIVGEEGNGLSFPHLYARTSAVAGTCFAGASPSSTEREKITVPGCSAGTSAGGGACCAPAQVTSPTAMAANHEIPHEPKPFCFLARAGEGRGVVDSSDCGGRCRAAS